MALMRASPSRLLLLHLLPSFIQVHFCTAIVLSTTFCVLLGWKTLLYRGRFSAWRLTLVPFIFQLGAGLKAVSLLYRSSRSLSVAAG